MAAYLIADIEVTDPETFELYRNGVPASIAPHGGKYLARGGRTESLEGGWDPKRIVIIEFPDMARLKAWYESAEYRRLIEIRQRSARARLLAVEGA